MFYKSLDPNWNEIRLLKLLPIGEDGRIRCLLDHVSLIDVPDYAAFSYRWGPPSPTKTIVINDIEVPVRTNLDAALRCLQAKGYERLWVDAICINQEDYAERNQQLLWMGSIYRRATEVAAWVEEEADGSNEAIAFMKRVSCKDRLGLENLENDKTSINAMEALLGREYWRRVWVIQELAFAKQAVIHCGQQAFSWGTLHSALDFCASAGHSVSGITLEYMRSLVSSPGFQNARGLAKFHVDAANNKPIHFLDALQRSLKSLATEPRNKIFALLGLTYDSGIYLPVPNYQQSIDTISRGMTLSAISITSSLDIIPLLGRGLNSRSAPSWVPNWFQLDDFCIARRVRYLHGIKDKAYQMTEMPTFSERRLQVKGVFIDEIDGLCPTLSEANNHSTLGASKLWPPFGHAKDLVDAMDVMKAFARTMTRKTISNHKFIPDFSFIARQIWYNEWDVFFTKSERIETLEQLKYEKGSWFTAVGELLIRGKTLADWIRISASSHNTDTDDMRRGRSERREINDILTDMMNVLGDDMRLMTTKIGYMGWAHPRAEKGDKVFILHGSSMPVILRPMPGSEKTYALVGDAFVENLSTFSTNITQVPEEDFPNQGNIGMATCIFDLDRGRTLIQQTKRSSLGLLSEEATLRRSGLNTMPPQALVLDPIHTQNADWEYLEIC